MRSLAGFEPQCRTVVVCATLIVSAIGVGALPAPLHAASVSVRVVDSPDPIVLGGTITYTFTVTNSGFPEVRFSAEVPTDFAAVAADPRCWLEESDPGFPSIFSCESISQFGTHTFWLTARPGRTGLRRVRAEARGISTAEIVDAYSGETTLVRAVGETTPTPSDLVFSVQSPTGSNLGLWTSAADGSNRAALTHRFAGSEPSWSPDGLKIVFSDDRQYGMALSMIDVASGQFTELTWGGAGAPDFQPAWSPTGDKIAFVRFASDYDVWVVNADGSEQTRLTYTGTFDQAPAWSPDGATLAYVRDEEIWLMDAAGGNARLLTWVGPGASGLEWSPGGSHIAYSAQESDAATETEIFVVTVPGGVVTRLTFNTAMDFSPTWSPAGAEIAFESALDVWIMNADGTGARNITNTPTEYEMGPDWGPARTPRILPVLSIGDAQWAEGDSGQSLMKFVVTRTGEGACSVVWSTSPGTATEGVDFASSSGEISFAGPASTAEISISIIGDTDHEPDEAFQVDLSSAVGAAIGRASGTGTIINDDPVPNTPPIADVAAIGSPFYLCNQPSQFSAAKSSDPDGDALTFSWSVDGTVIAGATASTLSYPFVALGPHSVSVVVFDGTDTSTATMTVAVGGCVDLAASITATPNPLPSSAQVTLTVTITNSGADAPYGAGVLIASQSPTNQVTAADVASAGGGTCVDAGMGVRCTWPSGGLAPGTSTVVTLTKSLMAAAVEFGVLAQAGPSDFESNTADNLSLVTVIIGDRQVDLTASITALPNPAPVAGSGGVLITATMTNASQNASAGATFSIGPIDGGFPIMGSDVVFVTPGATCVPQLPGLLCAVPGPFQPGAVVTVQLLKFFPSMGMFRFRAVAQAHPTADFDVQQSNNIATIDLVVRNSVDLTASITASPNPVLVGNEATFTVTVSNLGPDDATFTGVYIEPVGASPALTVADVQLIGSLCVPFQTTALWCGGSGFPAGHTASLTLKKVMTTLGEFEYAATASVVPPLQGATPMDDEIDPANDRATVKIIVKKNSIDLLTTITASPNPILIGSDATFTATMANQGVDAPSAARMVITPVSTAPGFTAADVVSSSGGTCLDFTNAALSCTWPAGALAPGSSVAVTLKKTITAAGTFSYGAQAGNDPAYDDDINPANDASTVILTSQLYQVDYSTALSASPSRVLAGDELILTAAISNSGPMAPKQAGSLWIGPDTRVGKNPGPALQLSDVTASAGAACVMTGSGSVGCTWPSALMQPGSSQTITVRKQMLTAGPFDYRALAEATMHEVDVDPGNDEAALRITVVGEYASLAAAAGQTVTTDSESDGATPADVIETSVTSPVAGVVTIIEPPLDNPPTPTAWSFLGQGVRISAPAATAANPLIIEFRIHGSLLPTGASVAVFRNGSSVPACQTATGANPDPCTSMSSWVGAEYVIRVRTSAASDWTFGVMLRDRGRVTGPGLSAESDGQSVKVVLNFAGFRSGADGAALNIEGPTAWIAGFGIDGVPFLIYVEDRGRGVDDVFKLWIGGDLASLPNGKLPNGDIKVESH